MSRSSGSHHRDPTISVVADGPLLVRGAVRIVDEQGREVVVRRRAVAICRCGRSSVQPFCDDTHKVVPFSPRTSSRTDPEASSSASPRAG